MSQHISKQFKENLNFGSYFSYFAGYILSLICTLSAYLLVVSHHASSKWIIAGWVASLAIIQFVIQILLFLHIGKESKPRFKLLVFGFMLSVVIILVAGSIWIIYSLNYRMQMSPTQIKNYIKSQNGGF
ncbi:MAG TPA: cytochrome C oxidase subunit IV family protein [Patescibacteria group bacterium]|nr:cytochrome C oxidase subunit IV family protein [Patescibacteria group bacterium]